MPTEALQSGPYPAGTAAPNVPADIQSVATWAAQRLVMRFASAPARSSALAAASVTPVAGMLCWLADSGWFEKYTGSVWQRLDWTTSWGIVGGANFGGSAALAAVVASDTYLNCNSGPVTILSGRRYRICWSGAVQAAVAGISVVITLRDGTSTASTALCEGRPMRLDDTGLSSIQGQIEFDATSTAGHTYGITGRTTSSTFTLFRSGNKQTFITVYDEGPGGIVATG